MAESTLQAPGRYYWVNRHTGRCIITDFDPTSPARSAEQPPLWRFTAVEEPFYCGTRRAEHIQAAARGLDGRDGWARETPAEFAERWAPTAPFDSRQYHFATCYRCQEDYAIDLQHLEED